MFLNIVPASPDLSEMVSKYSVTCNKWRWAAQLPSEVHLLFRGCHQSVYESWMISVREEYGQVTERERESGEGVVCGPGRGHLWFLTVWSTLHKEHQQAVCANTLPTCVCRKTGFSLVMETINHLRQSRLLIAITMVHPLRARSALPEQNRPLSILVFGSFLFLFLRGRHSIGKVMRDIIHITV